METASEVRTLISVPEVAALLGVGNTTVWRLVSERALPHFRIRGTVRIPRAAVDEYLARVLVPAK